MGIQYFELWVVSITLIKILDAHPMHPLYHPLLLGWGGVHRQWVINFGTLEQNLRMSPSTPSHQFGTPEVFFPGAPACTSHVDLPFYIFSFLSPFFPFFLSFFLYFPLFSLFPFSLFLCPSSARGGAPPPPPRYAPDVGSSLLSGFLHFVRMS